MLSSLWGIPLRIQPLFFLLAGFIGWANTQGQDLMSIFVWMFVIFISILWHELGHAITAIAFGQNVAIELTAFGGVTYRQGKKLRGWQDFIITLNGPLSGFLLASVSYNLYFMVNDWELNPYILLALTVATSINIVWSALNLLPILPLDGGQLMSIILEGIFGVRGMKCAYILSILLGLSLAIYGLVLGVFLPSMIVMMLVFDSIQSFFEVKNITDEDRDEDLLKLYHKAEAVDLKGESDKAYGLFKELAKRASKGHIYLASLIRMVEIHQERGEFEEGYDLLYPEKENVPEESYPLLHRLAFLNGDIPEVLRIADDCYRYDPCYDVAFITAMAYAVKNEVDHAVSWLECAQREGMPAMKQQIQQMEFDNIRRSQRFKEFDNVLEW